MATTWCAPTKEFKIANISKIYSGAAVEASPVKAVAPGEVFTVIDQAGEWYAVAGMSPSKNSEHIPEVVGWIPASAGSLQFKPSAFDSNEFVTMAFRQAMKKVAEFKKKLNQK